MDMVTWMFPVLLTLIFLGVPIAFALMSTAFMFGIFRFGENLFFVFLHKIDDITGASILAAVPLFVFMGAMLEKSGTAEKFLKRYTSGHIVCGWLGGRHHINVCHLRCL